MTKHYNFEKQTGRLLGQGECQTCPITKKVLYPANSTYKKPPKCAKDEYPAFENDEWVIKIDHKKRVQLNPETLKLENGISTELSAQDIADRLAKKEAKRAKEEAQATISGLEKLAMERAKESFLTKEEKDSLQAAELLLKS